jgi:DNA-binding XRE family transcriptional regulator
VATLIGCGETTIVKIVNWEKGQRTPRIKHMGGIIRLLGYNPLPAGGNIAEGLIAYRKSRGLTQKEFARELGVDPSTLAGWERGDRQPAGKYIAAILTHSTGD